VELFLYMLAGFMFRDVIQLDSLSSTMMTVILIFLTCSFCLYFLFSAGKVLLKVCGRWKTKREKQRNLRHFEDQDLPEDHVPLSPSRPHHHHRNSTSSVGEEKGMRGAPRQEGEPYGERSEIHSANHSRQGSLSTVGTLRVGSNPLERQGEKSVLESHLDNSKRDSISQPSNFRPLPGLRTPQKAPPSKLGLDALAEDDDDERTLMIREASQQQHPDHVPVEVKPLNFPRPETATPTPSIQPIAEKPRVQVHENPDEDEDEEEEKRRDSDQKQLQQRHTPENRQPRHTPENRQGQATPQPQEAEVYNGGPAANLRIVWPEGDEDDEEEDEHEGGSARFNVHGAPSEAPSMGLEADNPQGSTQGDLPTLEAELVERAPSRQGEA